MRAEGAWSPDVEMLASIVEELDALLRLTYQASAGKRAPWKAVRISRPRPEDERAVERREADPDELLRILTGGGIRGR